MRTTNLEEVEITYDSLKLYILFFRIVINPLPLFFHDFGPHRQIRRLCPTEGHKGCCICFSPLYIYLSSPNDCIYKLALTPAAEGNHTPHNQHCSAVSVRGASKC